MEKGKKIGIVTSFYRGIPYHMKNSGYERLIDYISKDNVYFSKKSKWTYRALAPFAHTNLIPLSYAFFNEEIRALRENDIIHHLYGEDTFFLSPMLKKNKKIVVTFHTPVERFKKVSPFFMNKLINGIDIIAVAPSQLRYFQNILKDPSKVRLIPVGVDTNTFRPKTKINKKYILSVGAHLRDYNTIINAMEIVSKKYPQIRLVIVSGKFKSCSQNIIVKKNISDEELVDLYHESMFQIISLKNATANLALLEGFAHGLPCIINNLEDVKFYTKDKGCLYFNTEDYASLAGQAINLIEKKRLREALSKEARERALELDWKNIAQKIEEVYYG